MINHEPSETGTTVTHTPAHVKRGRRCRPPERRGCRHLHTVRARSISDREPPVPEDSAAGFWTRRRTRVLRPALSAALLVSGLWSSEIRKLEVVDSSGVRTTQVWNQPPAYIGMVDDLTVESVSSVSHAVVLAPDGDSGSWCSDSEESTTSSRTSVVTKRWASFSR